MRQRNFLTICVCIIFAPVVLASPARAQAPYVNPELKFGFTPPSGWVMKKGSSPKADLAIAYVEPGPTTALLGNGRRETDKQFAQRIKNKLRDKVDNTASFQANISVLCLNIGTVTLDEYARETRTRAQQALHEQRAKGGTVAYEIITEKPRKLAGLPAYERFNRVLVAGGTRVQMREVLCVQDKKLYTISLTVPDGAMPRYSREFDRVLASFTWKG